MRKRKRQRVGVDLIKGMMVGAVATWIMDRVTTVLYQREDQKAQRRENAARGGTTAYAAAATKVARLGGRSLPAKKAERAGTAIHWALGIGTAGVYAMLRRKRRLLAAAAGLPFGAAFWLVADELAVPLLGLTPGPQAFPWQTHARGLVGHLTYGLVTEEGLRLLDRAV